MYQIWVLIFWLFPESISIWVVIMIRAKCGILYEGSIPKHGYLGKRLSGDIFSRRLKLLTLMTPHFWSAYLMDHYSEEHKCLRETMEENKTMVYTYTYTVRIEKYLAMYIKHQKYVYVIIFTWVKIFDLSQYFQHLKVGTKLASFKLTSPLVCSQRTRKALKSNLKMFPFQKMLWLLYGTIFEGWQGLQ
jgi:hypothetical protein